MARSNESTNSQLPAEDDQKGYRHFGDGIAGPVVASRLQGFDTDSLTYIDVAVDSSGVVQVSSSGGGGGSVTQGTTPWVVSGSVTASGSVTVSGSVAVTGGTIGTITNSVPVTGAFYQTTQPVSGSVTASGSVTVSGSVAVTGGTIGTITNSVPVTGSFYQVTQPVSGTVTATGSVTVSGSVTTLKTAQTAVVPTSFSATATSTQAIENNASRTGLVVTNLSATNSVSLGLGTTAIASSGITLNANGGVWVMDQYTFTTQSVTAIAASASTLAIQELN